MNYYMMMYCQVNRVIKSKTSAHAHIVRRIEFEWSSGLGAARLI